MKIELESRLHCINIFAYYCIKYFDINFESPSKSYFKDLKLCKDVNI